MSKSVKGTTHKIREQLQFTDNKKWKLFSTRRLELIDRFKLFEKKASEQDCNIERIANILRTEFDYSIEHQLDFEKLVTAAVQSVRRNRKRSKNLNGQSEEFIPSLESKPSSPTLLKIKQESSKENTGFNPNTSNSLLHNKVNKLPRSPPHSIAPLNRNNVYNKPVTISVAVSQRSNNSGSDSESNKIPSPSLSPITSPLHLTRNSPLMNQTSLQSFPSASISSSNNTNLNYNLASNKIKNIDNNNIAYNKNSSNNVNIINDNKNPSFPFNIHSGNSSSLPPLSSNRITLPPIQSLSNKKQTKAKPKKHVSSEKIEGSNIEIVKSIIADIVFQKVNLKDQMLNFVDTNNSPSKSDIPNATNGDLSLEFFALSSQNRDLLPIALKQLGNNNKMTPSTSSQSSLPSVNQSYNCPFFLKSKILSQINNSKTCHDICSKQGSYKDIYCNILEMGDLGFRSCLMFIFERFHGMNTAMISYLKEKLLTGDKAEERVIQIIENLFENATLRDLHSLKAEFKIDLFKLCIGSLIKDFGFDPVIYSLGEIFQDYILKELSPFISGPAVGENLTQSLNSTSSITNSKNLSRINSNNLAQSMIVSTAPLDPSEANNSIYRKVVIRKGDKKQEFTFYPLSNGTPTISEILETCFALFGLNSSSNPVPATSSTKVQKLLQKGNERNIHSNAQTVNKKLGMSGQYGLYHNNQLLKSDMELSTLLTNFAFNAKEIILDIKEFGISNASTTQRSTSPTPIDSSTGNDGLNILSNVAFVSSNRAA
ncbi:hypothetical protein QEN19_003071 [Hanseniaspora menglaensis]